MTPDLEALAIRLEQWAAINREHIAQFEADGRTPHPFFHAHATEYERWAQAIRAAPPPPS